MVVPTRDADLLYIKHNLHTYLRIGADEMILCIDEDSNQTFIDELNSIYDGIKKKYSNVSELKILKVEKRSDYNFHQAWVRRKGFLTAKNDVILTGDIDLHINKKVLKAIDIVGKNNVGLASLQKFQLQSNLNNSVTTIWRIFYLTLLRTLYHSIFTGLYAMYRPYWLETEDEKIKELKNPKFTKGFESVIGEDTYLRDFMEKKYKCVYLRDTGAIDFGIALHDDKKVQFTMGRYYLHNDRVLWQVLIAAFAYYHPDSIVGYFYEKNKIKKGLAKLHDVV